MKGRITEKGKAVVELMEHKGISLEEALERMDPPAGRGDTTQSDPAMIERAKQAGLAAARLLRASRARLSPATPGLLSGLERALIDVAVEAAAGVIVPATAETIATAQEATGINNAPQFAAIARSFAVPEASHD